MAGNPIQELMAMAGGGGGGPPAAGGPPGMPPAMDAAMGQRAGMGAPAGGGGIMGALGPALGPMIAQFIQGMMNDPQAMAAIGGVLSDMAGPQNDPRMRQAMQGGPQGQMAPPPMGMMAPDDINAGHDGPEYEGVSPAAQTSDDLDRVDSTEAELEAVNRNMGAEGEPEWTGTRAPTSDDVDLLLSDPAAYAASFDARFGEGAADRYLAEDNGDDDGADPEVEDDPY